MAGFGFAETMSGTWERTDGARGGGRFEFTVTVRSGPLGDFRRSRTAAITGTVTAEGLAVERPLEGTLEMRPFLGRIIRYEFGFTGTDGARYRFAGQKDIRWLDPLRTWTELPGTVTTEAGAVIGSATTRFDLRHRGADFVKSFRFA